MSKDKEVYGPPYIKDEFDPLVIDLLEGMTDEDLAAMKAALEDISNE